MAGPKDSSASTSKHVAVFMFPFTSHPQNLLALTRRLSAASPLTTTFSFFGTKKHILAMLPEAPDNNNFPNIRPFTIHDGIPEGYVPFHDPKRTGVQLEPLDLFLKTAPKNFRAAAAEAEAAVGCKISCLVSLSFLWFMDELAAEMGVPWVAVQTCSPRHIMASLNFDLIRTTVGMTAGYEEKTLEFIPGFSTTRCKDLPPAMMSGNLESPFARILRGMGQTLPKATAVVINSVEEADPIATEYLNSKLQKSLHIGSFILAFPPPLKDDQACIPWLDAQDPRSVVYLSFGTSVEPKPEEMTALAEALKETGYPFIWALKGKPEEKIPGDLVGALKEKGKFVSWAPQPEVLSHRAVGIFVTHCGWNSLLESIFGGVVMIGRPFFGDQPLYRVNMEEVLRIGVGVKGGSFTKDGVLQALRMIMTEEEGKCMRERVGALKEAALKSMGSDGSSTCNFKSLVEIVNK